MLMGVENVLFAIIFLRIASIHPCATVRAACDGKNIIFVLGARQMVFCDSWNHAISHNKKCQQQQLTCIRCFAACLHEELSIEVLEQFGRTRYIHVDVDRRVHFSLANSFWPNSNLHCCGNSSISIQFTRSYCAYSYSKLQTAISFDAIGMNRFFQTGPTEWMD